MKETDSLIVLTARVVDQTRNLILAIGGSGEAEIDWGDGSPAETVTLAGFPPVSDTEAFLGMTVWDCARHKLAFAEYEGAYTEWDFKHEYAVNGKKNIRVKGNVVLLEARRYWWKLSALDISRAAGLQYLDCAGSGIPALDTEKTPCLEYLDCSGCRLDFLDLRKNPSLEYLNCSSNRLGALDLRKHASLTHLECSRNRLTAFIPDKLPALRYLDCSNNKIAALKVNKNPALTELRCRGNVLDRAALLALFRSLPSNNTGSIRNRINCDSNPGCRELSEDDTAVAENRNWMVSGAHPGAKRDPFKVKKAAEKLVMQVVPSRARKSPKP